jgi:phosphoribosylformylglycinamidine cyclo-ligase
MPSSRMSYARAGVDRGQISAAHRILARKLATTFQTRKRRFGQPVFPIGHYAGLVDIGDGRVLSLHTDSVGTKVMVAQLMRKYDTIGIDCVAMCANDLICTGSEPVAFLDYLAVSKPNSAVTAEIADGLVEGARQAGMAIVGGELAVTPDLLSSGPGGGMDLVGMGVGVCSRDKLVLGDRVRNGDAVVGVASSGIHSNGLTMARKVLLMKHSLRERIPELGRSLGEELLEPTRIYVKPVLECLRKTEIHGLAHITGGSFSKIGRIVSQAGLGLEIEELPKPSPIFKMIQQEGRVSESEMRGTFNMGIGLTAICPESKADRVIQIFNRHRQNAMRIGRVRKKPGVRFQGKAVS